jgi:hypothetical protein
MANRLFKEMQSLDSEVKVLYGAVTFGASGAVSSVSANGFTVTKPAGTGLYTVTLDDKYSSLLGVDATLFNAGTAANSAIQLSSDFASSNTFQFQFLTAGAAANALTGQRLYVTIHLRNSALARKGGG